MIKNIDSTPSWVIIDNKRDTYNVADIALYPNSSSADESWSYLIDFLSNGFKLRYAHPIVDGSGTKYIYIAFAENPFKYTNAR